MAFSASALSGDLARAWSVGPVKFELQSFSMLTTDTTGSVTSNALSRIDDAVVIGGPETTGITISGTTVSLTFADPAAACTGYSAATAKGRILLIGR